MTDTAMVVLAVLLLLHASSVTIATTMEEYVEQVSTMPSHGIEEGQEIRAFGVEQSPFDDPAPHRSDPCPIVGQTEVFEVDAKPDRLRAIHIRHGVKVGGTLNKYERDDHYCHDWSWD